MLSTNEDGDRDRGYVSHRGTEGMEAAGQARLAQRGIYKKYLDLIYILVHFNLFGYSRNREDRAGCFTAVSTEKEPISFTPDHIYGMKARRNDKSRYFL